jgi:multiple sugar transport system substrate-binding protein
VDAGCTQPNPGTTDRTSGAWPLFAQGVAAMVNGAIFLPGELKNTYQSDVNYGVSPFPANDGKDSVTLGVQDYFFAFKKEGNQEAVQKFLSFLYEPDNYAAFLEAAGGFLPATISAGEAMSSDPAIAPFIEVLPTAIFYPSDQAAWPAVQGAIQQTIGTALAGTDKQQVLDQIQAATEE